MTESTKPKRKYQPKPRTSYEVTLPPVVQTEINPITGRELPVIPKGYKFVKDVSMDQVRAQFLMAYELIGGAPRLAIWADANPDEFYKTFAKLAPETTSKKVGVQAIQINMNGGDLPTSPLDDVEIRDESVVNANWTERTTDDE